MKRIEQMENVLNWGSDAWDEHKIRLCENSRFCLSWMRRAVPHLQAWLEQLPQYDTTGDNISAQIEALEQLLKELGE